MFVVMNILPLILNDLDVDIGARVIRKDERQK